MAEDLNINTTLNRAERYEQLFPQIKGLLTGESDLVANMANISAALREAFDFWWVGFYLSKDNELVLGPFQGPVACTRIAYGKGVCGTAFSKQETIIVPDVDAFPGHIACSAQSKSEIVIPVRQRHEIIGVLDVDSDQPDDFSETDRIWLEKIVNLLNV